MKQLYILSIILALASSCTYKKADLKPKAPPLPAACDTSGTISYLKDIVPIMNTSCGAQNNTCHTSSFAGGNVILDIHLGVNYVALNGRMMSSITWDGNTSFMPKNSSIKLSDCNIAKIKRWITEGAPNN